MAFRGAAYDRPVTSQDQPVGLANIVHCNAGRSLGVERESIRELVDGGAFFWLDLHDPAASDLEILREEFGFHPLSLEDSWRFGQRPKLDDYDGYVFLVVYGASSEGDADGLVELHCFYSDRFLITLHRDDAPSLAACASATSSAPRLSMTRRGCSTGSSTASSTASSRASRRSTRGSTRSRTRSSATPATGSCRRSSR